MRREVLPEKEYQDLREEIIYAEEDLKSVYDRELSDGSTAFDADVRYENNLEKTLTPLNKKLVELKNKLAT